MKTIYACTFVDKTAEVDDFEQGCLPGTATCVLAELCHIRADTLAGLIKRIGEHFGLDIDDVFLPEADDEGISHMGFNRLENADGYEPTQAQEAAWKRGQEKLYQADYLFVIEKMQLLKIDDAEFDAAGIKHH